MWSAGVEPARPAFQAGALPFELRPQRWARLDSNQRPLVCKTSAQPAELLARVKVSWAELESNQPPPPYQRGALPPEPPALRSSGTRTRTSISTFRAWRPSALDDPGPWRRAPKTARRRSVDEHHVAVHVDDLQLDRQVLSRE